MSLNAILVEEGDMISRESITLTHPSIPVVYGRPVRIPVYTVISDDIAVEYEAYCGPVSWICSVFVALVCCPLAPFVACCPCDLRRRRTVYFSTVEDVS